MHRLSQRIGIGFQNPATQLSQVTDTVFEEVAFGPMNLALPRDEVVGLTWAALESLRIDGLAERDPARLSGGQQQLVALAGLLAMRPGHLVLDERPCARSRRTRWWPTPPSAPGRGGASILVAEQKTAARRRVSRVVGLHTDACSARPAPTSLAIPAARPGRRAVARRLRRAPRPRAFPQRACRVAGRC